MSFNGSDVVLGHQDTTRDWTESGCKELLNIPGYNGDCFMMDRWHKFCHYWGRKNFELADD